MQMQPSSPPSSNKGEIFCLVRNEWIKSFPEELIRQKLLHEMVDQLGFPKGLLAVEKAIKQLPHLSDSERAGAPDRRVDILCFAKENKQKKEKLTIDSLLPLLTIECKSVKLSAHVIEQVLGYNHYIRSRFIAVANGDEMRVGWFDDQLKHYHFIDYLPPYLALCSMPSSEHLN